MDCRGPGLLWRPGRLWRPRPGGGGGGGGGPGGLAELGEVSLPQFCWVFFGFFRPPPPLVGGAEVAPGAGVTPVCGT